MCIRDRTGPQGKPGEAGPKGETGEPGKDGVSPTLSIGSITGGHRITITDAAGSKSFDVKDGENGKDASITSAAIVKALGYTPYNPNKMCIRDSLREAAPGCLLWCRWDRILEREVGTSDRKTEDFCG